MLAAPSAALGLLNDVGAAPTMGWSTWNTFRCDIDEGLIRQMAESLERHGLAAAGYRFVNIDDCWSERARDADGRLVVSPTKFPAGMKALADQLHARGLKLGLYGDVGNQTCEGFPGSFGYEATDADTYASFGVDFLKQDFCKAQKLLRDHPALTAQKVYSRMRDALNATGRRVVVSRRATRPITTPLPLRGRV